MCLLNECNLFAVFMLNVSVAFYSSDHLPLSLYSLPVPGQKYWCVSLVLNLSLKPRIAHSLVQKFAYDDWSVVYSFAF